jgi:chitinase
MPLRSAALIAAAFCLTSAASAAPVVHYQAVDLLALGNATQSSGAGIANGGATTGASYTGAAAGSPAHAFRSMPGGPQDLGALAAGAYSEGRAINASGVVVGSSQVAADSANFHATSWTGSAPIDINPTGGLFSRATAINQSGQVAGYYGHYFDGFGGQITSAFVLTNGSVQRLSPLAGNFASASGINDGGMVVGSTTIVDGGSLQHGFFHDGTTMHDIGALSAGLDSHANAINNAAQVVGSAQVAPGQSHAVLYANGALTDLGLLSGTTSTEAVDINESGVIVGTAFGGNSRHGFVAFDQELYDLVDLIAGGFDGWHILDISGINDQGQIVGTAQSDDGSLVHAFRFDPINVANVPEPAGLALMLAALGAAGFATRRRQ